MKRDSDPNLWRNLHLRIQLKMFLRIFLLLLSDFGADEMCWNVIDTHILPKTAHQINFKSKTCFDTTLQSALLLSVAGLASLRWLVFSGNLHDCQWTKQNNKFLLEFSNSTATAHTLNRKNPIKNKKKKTSMNFSSCALERSLNLCYAKNFRRHAKLFAKFLDAELRKWISRRRHLL